jgi:hypothetical protein
VRFGVSGVALCLLAITGATSAGGATASAPAWRVSHVFTGQPLSNLLAVTATGSKDAWTFGDGKNSRPAAVHWNGVTWTISYLPGATDRPDQVSETSRTNVWAAGGTCGSVSTIPYVSRWNGSKWTTTLFPKANCGASAVVTTGPSDGWLFNQNSESPTVALHFTGKTWKSVSLGKVGTVVSASAVSQKNVWAVSYTVKDQMLIEHWNGASWHTVTVPAAPVPKGDDTYPIQFVAAGTSDMWLTTDIVRNNYEVNGPLRSVVLHWNGNAWHWLTVPYADLALEATSDGQGGIWTTAMINSPSSAYDFVHFSGRSWSRQAAPTAGISPSDITTDVYSLALIPGTQTLWASGDAFWYPSPTTSATASVMFKFGS